MLPERTALLSDRCAHRRCYDILQWPEQEFARGEPMLVGHTRVFRDRKEADQSGCECFSFTLQCGRLYINRQSMLRLAQLDIFLSEERLILPVQREQNKINQDVCSQITTTESLQGLTDRVAAGDLGPLLRMWLCHIPTNASACSGRVPWSFAASMRTANSRSP